MLDELGALRVRCVFTQVGSHHVCDEDILELVANFLRWRVFAGDVALEGLLSAFKLSLAAASADLVNSVPDDPRRWPASAGPEVESGAFSSSGHRAVSIMA